MRFPSAQPSILPLLVLLQQHAAAAISIPSTYLLLSGSPPPLGQPESQIPNQNILAYLSTNPETSAPISSSSLCTSFLSNDKTALLLPSAHIPLSSAGFIDCFLEPPHQQQQQFRELEQEPRHKKRLLFDGIPAGWQFSITEISIGGWLELEKGSLVERVEVGVWYPELPHHQYGGGEGSDGNSLRKTDGDRASVKDGNGDGKEHGEAESDKTWKWKWDLKRYLPLHLSTQTQPQNPRSETPTTQPFQCRNKGLIDKATALTPCGRFGAGYQGRFNLSMPVKPSGGSRSRKELAVSPCSMGPDMEIAVSVELWFSLSMEQIEVGEAAVHRGMLGGDGEPGSERESGEKMLRLGLRGKWSRC